MTSFRLCGGWRIKTFTLRAGKAEKRGWSLAAIWPSPFPYSCAPEAASQSFDQRPPLLVTTHSHSSVSLRGLGSGHMGEESSAIISFSTNSFQKPRVPQQFFPGGKCPCLVSAQRRISMESLRKIPSGWGCEKSLCLSHLEKKGKNILETWLFLSHIQKELTWTVLTQPAFPSLCW